MSRRARLGRIAASFGSSLLMQARNLVVSVVVFRLFTDPKELWGTVNHVAAVVTMLSLPAKFGLEFTAVQFVSKYRDDDPASALASLKQSTTLRVLLTLLFGLPMILVPEAVAAVTGLGELPHLVAVGGWLLLSASFYEYGSFLLSGADNFGGMMVSRLLYSLANIGGIAVVAYAYTTKDAAGPILWAQVAAGFLAAAWCAVITLVEARRLEQRAATAAPETPGLRGGELFRSIVLFSVPVTLVSAAGQIFSYLDRVMIPYLSSHEELGSYAVANSVISAALFGSYAFRNVARTRIPGELRRDPAKARETLLATYRASYAVSVWIGAGILAVAPYLMVAIYGKHAGEAAEMLMWFVPYVVLSAHANFSATALVAADRPKIYALLMGALAAFNFVLNLFLIPAMGGYGAIVASTVSLVPLVVLAYREVARAFGEELWTWRTVLDGVPTTARLAAFGAIAAVPGWWVSRPSLLWATAGGLVVTAVFAALLWAGGELKTLRRAT